MKRPLFALVLFFIATISNAQVEPENKDYQKIGKKRSFPNRGKGEKYLLGQKNRAYY